MTATVTDLSAIRAQAAERIAYEEQQFGGVNSKLVASCLHRNERGERTYCSGCDQKFSPTIGTVLENSRLTFRQYEKLMLCLSMGCTEQRTAQVAGLHIDTVRAWIVKLRVLGVLGA